ERRQLGIVERAGAAPIDEHFAACREIHGSSEVQQRSLAAAAAPHQGGYRPRRGHERNIVQNLGRLASIAVGFGNSTQLHAGRAHLAPFYAGGPGSFAAVAPSNQCTPAHATKLSRTLKAAGIDDNRTATVRRYCKSLSPRLCGVRGARPLEHASDRRSYARGCPGDYESPENLWRHGRPAVGGKHREALPCRSLSCKSVL